MHARFPQSFTRLGAAALAVGALALAGCGGPEIIARVGDRTITVADYESAARGAAFRYPGPADSAKAKLLEDLVRQELLLEFGFKTGILVDSMARLDFKTIEDQALRAALIQRLIPASVGVSDAEVRQFWAWRDSASHCQLIYTASFEMAAAAAAEIARGVDFGATANRYNLAGVLPPEGDLGWVLPGTLADPLDRMAREMAWGETVGPVRAPGQGWFVLRVLERQKGQRDSFHLEAPRLEQALQQRKRRLLSSRAFEALRDQYQVKLELGAAQAMFGYFNTPGAAGLPDPQSTAAPLTQTIARYDGGGGHAGTYTLGDALHDLESSEGERPNASMLSSFGPWIESRVVERVVLVEARRRHLHQDPAITRPLEERYESEMLNSVFNEAVVQVARPVEDDLRATYARGRLPEDPPFELLDAARMQSLAFDAIEVARMRRFTTLSDSLRAALPVTVDAAAVKRLRWPIGS